MEKTVVAVIGCGRISNCAHFPALSELDNVRIKYACDLIIEKAQAVKEKYPKVENICTDYNVILNDPEVEIVWVLTPNYAHYTVTMDVLKAGKHVFCEKPITVNYALSCEMAEEAHKQNKLLNIGVCNRFHKSVQELKRLNDEGKFGKIYHVYASFRAFRSIPGLGGAFTTKSQSGGGVLIDWGVHFIDLIFYILGGVKIKTVTCDTYSEIAKDMKAYKYSAMWAEETKDVENGTNDVDDFVTGYMRTDKATISLNGAWAQNLEEGGMFIDFLGDKGGARLNYCGLFSFTNGETLETEHPEYDIPNMYLEEDRDFIRCVKEGKTNQSYIDNILESAKALDYLYQSAEKHEEIKL